MPIKNKEALAGILLKKHNPTIESNAQTQAMALEAINILIQTAATEHYHHLQNKLKTPASDIEQILETLLANSKQPIFDVAGKQPKLTDTAKETLIASAFTLEQNLLQQAQNISQQERLEYHSRLQTLAERGKIIPQESWLSGLDIQEALHQQAIDAHGDGSDISDKFNAVQIVGFDDNNTSNINQLSKVLAKQDTNNLPTNIVLYYNQHWTQLKVSTTHDGKISAEIVDPQKNENPAFVNLNTDVIQVALKQAFPKKQVNKPTYRATKQQQDGWSCGYQVLKNISQDIAGTNDQYLPKSDDINTLRDWTYNLVIGQTSNEYHDSLKQSAVLCQQSRETYTKPLSAKSRLWYQQFANTADLEFSQTSNKACTLTPKSAKDKSGSIAKPPISITSKQVGIQGAENLDTTSKQNIAETMAKAYIAQKLGLPDNQLDMPDKATIQAKNIQCMPIRGNDEELKQMIHKSLENYGVTIRSDLAAKQEEEIEVTPVSPNSPK